MVERSNEHRLDPAFCAGEVAAVVNAVDSPRRTPTQVAVVIPAKDEADLIAATVRACQALPHVDLVVVVDDGSSDGTGREAVAAGAEVIRHQTNSGKSAAMTSGAAWAAAADAGGPPRALLFVDADLGESASTLAPLIVPVVEGTADLTVAVIPRSHSSKGAGRAVRLARNEIRRRTGVEITQPLNGMRCLTRAAYDAAAPLARGWGVETGMLLSVLGAGLRVVEVPVDFTHRASGPDWAGRRHRARQLRDIASVVARSRLSRH